MVDVEAWSQQGVLKIEQPELRTAADAARARLWRQIGLTPDDSTAWTKPVVWTADMTGDGPFGELARSPRLADALDRVCGPGVWQPRGALGNIPVRFPVRPGDDDRGWHVDLNTPQPDGSWLVSARPHTMLVLTLLSDVGPRDAPTRIRIGSHRAVAAALGDRALDAVAAGAIAERASADCAVIPATGTAGDVYLLHPLTVHAADEHRGSTPRFMAQGPVLLTRPLTP
ncbi:MULTISPECIES: phytanoyl-CoA dioxygenase family protein [Mycobacteriaceae]|uniref:phytanoyl-CoA dioxygenase family protein n=1 Tax=Mycobacteriaceae TaxID=1762 RepID=UPI0007FC8C55|nr:MULTISPECIES: phytanoyl-CoA dioxygenase family protein [Mycobacteriaceae]MCK0174166.1 phytanoyl-CoA dioxygenase family protein [Mycolicibacterium sp. F2034L]OBB62005.1 mitomycin antibiotics/polyketide fumonisin biosynthesis protein [Mycobacterium sp. 852013-51886_SCH5428379]